MEIRKCPECNCDVFKVKVEYKGNEKDLYKNGKFIFEGAMTVYMIKKFYCSSCGRKIAITQSKFVHENDEKLK
ncbi:hypothetical protein BG261_02890 [Floricoccus tropicus]|uniref:Uncharacterized protein n=1 Tax=Floricoccus tropicus TaxID=1859473 RepID=A0A1E8GMR4_9LACT|nr:hypothetical protein [Floricoccus tropicus]OFI49541.1 hypothetical protein BG261_02890 [Floricoccus tropicus]